jgi:mono/diheme cytochrome c family protein
MRFRLALIASFAIVAGLAAQTTPDADDVAEGMRLYRTKGDCQSCHGWAADGRKMDTQMPDGANLRTTRLNRELLLMTIKCGRPGKGMPAYDRLAYSDGRCYNMKAADLQS